MENKPTIGVIGSGRLGTALARLLLGAGYEVRIANSRGPESLELLLSVLLPGAIATTVDEAVIRSDVVILALPSGNYTALDPLLFKNKIVIDATNYWAPTEGIIDEFVTTRQSTSEVIQHHFANAIVVKALNHIAYNELEEHHLPHGDSDRRAVLIASDDQVARHIVMNIIDTIGFDPVDMGELSEGVRFQPDTPLFNARFKKDDINKRHQINKRQ